LDAETCRGFNEHNKLFTTPLSISWFLSPIHEKCLVQRSSYFTVIKQDSIMSRRLFAKISEEPAAFIYKVNNIYILKNVSRRS
jgi:hypothetical protein